MKVGAPLARSENVKTIVHLPAFHPGVFLRFHGSFVVWQKSEGTRVLVKIIFSPFVLLFLEGINVFCQKIKLM